MAYLQHFMQGFGAYPQEFSEEFGEETPQTQAIVPVPAPTPFSLSILDELKPFLHTRAAIFVGIGLAVLLYFFLKEKKYL